ncbi:MAG: winged helix-turn-helix domain-containing protein [Pseudomonadota bacterium]
MIYAFDAFLLDTERRELSRGGTPVPAEPQVLDLLMLLVGNHHRVVSKAELVEKIWCGRIVSDWAVSSRIRDLRRVLGDDGRAQAMLKTYRGRGVRFVGSVEIRAEPMPAVPALSSEGPAGHATACARRPSIAILPFALVGAAEADTALAEAIPRELIAALASLRWIKVISHGSTFQFRSRSQNLQQLGTVLGAAYCLSGSVETVCGRTAIDVELADKRSGEVIWADRREAASDDVLAMRADIARDVIAVAELEIPQHEAARLAFTSVENLDAWSALHLGVQKMNQFSRDGNAAAERLFEIAIRKEPDLARAHAGLAFVRFQNAFMKYTGTAERDARAALEAAERGFALQPKDPFTNFMMGRCHWLSGDPEGSRTWFERAIHVSPNYTWGHYGLSWAAVFTGDYTTGMEHADTAIELSPIDPMRPGMTGNKMWVHIAEENYPEAVRWAEIAARVPWSHAGMALFAAMSHWLNGDPERRDWWMGEVRRRNPDFDREHLLTIVPSTNPAFRDLVVRFARDLAL